MPDLTDFCVYGYPNDSILVVTTWLRIVTDNDDSFATYPAWDLPAVGFLFCPPGDEFGILECSEFLERSTGAPCIFSELNGKMTMEGEMFTVDRFTQIPEKGALFTSWPSLFDNQQTPVLRTRTCRP